jgi:hypothetical protein
MITILVVKTDCYSDSYCDALEEGRSSLPEILYSIFSTVYSTSKDQVAEKFVFLFKEKAVFKQCTAKKYKCFSMKTYKLCNCTGYTDSIKVYWRKDTECPTQQLTAAHVRVT